ncbi:MAG: DUF308 domain-containing protein [Bacteroidales bacterium]|nr:DUF308 domain-containing protein [Bacteroidales bacterium]
MTNILIRNWSIYLLNGIVALLYGIFALFIPSETLVIMAWYAGLVILLGGILVLLVVANRIRKELPYGWQLAQAILYMAIGALVMIYTNESIHFFVAAMGVLAIIAGILQLIVLINIDPSFGGKNLMLVNALITLAFGVLMLVNPFTVAQAFVILSGLMAMVFGSLLIWFSFRLRELQKHQIS